eukprot:TRINITY_DN7193_c0_g2_i1.p1 TRINITY_DN7193_c0_g2~~TRINITY_DN7193_c0_g2_i1.p1  ORF type:complete len:274 (-),score=25.16 TRINITY_DN7193_c0_g2_i1:195-962(-)
MDAESKDTELSERMNPEMSEAESDHSRDSLDSFLERGNSYSADSFDVEAYRFAQWWNRFNATDDAEQEVSNPGVAASRRLYRRYATAQAYARVSNALQVPFVVRHIVKQDFFSLRLLFDHGMTCGGTTYHLTAELAEWILRFLGYQEKNAGPPYSRSNCITFDMLCPVFKHRMLRAARREHVSVDRQIDVSLSSFSSSTPSSSADSDDESVVSTGSVSAAGDLLLKYLKSRRPLRAESDTQVDEIEFSTSPVEAI